MTPTGLRESFTTKGLGWKTAPNALKSDQGLKGRFGKPFADPPPPKTRNAAPVGAGNGGSACKAANLSPDYTRALPDRQAERLRRVAHVSEPVARVLALACYGRASG